VSIYFDLPHLVGLRLPEIGMWFVDGSTEDVASFPEDLASFARKGPLVIYTFPGIDWWADAPQVSDEDAAQAADFCAYSAEFAELGFRIVGISTQSIGELAKWVKRETIGYLLASDDKLRLADALALPTARPEQVRVYQRLMLIVRDGRIRKVFYPVKEPNHAAGQVLSWLYQAQRGR